MGTQAAAVHQQVIERTKGLMYRTQMVSASIDKKLASLQKQPYSEPFAVSRHSYNKFERKDGYNIIWFTLFLYPLFRWHGERMMDKENIFIVFLAKNKYNISAINSCVFNQQLYKCCIFFLVGILSLFLHFFLYIRTTNAWRFCFSYPK